MKESSMNNNAPKRYFTTTIDDVEVVVFSVSLPTSPKEGEKFSTRTSLSSQANKALGKVEDVMEGMKPVLKGIATKGREILNTDIPGPDELTLTLGMGYSVEGNMWVIGGKSELTFEVEMKWKRPKK